VVKEYGQQQQVARQHLRLLLVHVKVHGRAPASRAAGCAPWSAARGEVVDAGLQN
jgi:hypothetical protein